MAASGKLRRSEDRLNEDRLRAGCEGAGGQGGEESFAALASRTLPDHGSGHSTRVTPPDPAQHFVRKMQPPNTTPLLRYRMAVGGY